MRLNVRVVPNDLSERAHVEFLSVLDERPSVPSVGDVRCDGQVCERDDLPNGQRGDDGVDSEPLRS